MAYRHLALTEGGTRLDPYRRLAPPGAWRSLEVIAAEVDEAANAGEQLVVLVGGNPGGHPKLAEIAAAVSRAGMSTATIGPASMLDPTALRCAGVDVVWLMAHGDQTTHDALVGAGDHDALMAWAAATSRPRIRLVSALSGATATSVHQPLAALGAVAEQIVLEAVSDDPVPAEDLPAVLEAVRLALVGLPVELELTGVHLGPDLDPGVARAPDEHLLAIRRQGGWLPGLSAGIAGDAGAAAVECHALGIGNPELPRPEPVVRGRTAIVVPALGDALLGLSTLPALSQGLADLGVEVTLQSVWNRPWNLHDPGPGTALAAQLDSDAVQRRRKVAQHLEERFFARLDLSGVDTIVAPGWELGHRVYTHPTRDPSSRVVVLDFHMLAGIDRWGPTPDGAWWPGDDLRVVSCFPGFVPMARAQGVPLEAVTWAPYPVDPALLPDASAQGPPLSAGNQRRDWDLLARALTHRDPGAVALQAITGAALPPIDGLVSEPAVSLVALAERVANARYVVLPVQVRATDAAGITLASMALAAGVPVVATNAWGMVDHVRHGTSGLIATTASDLGWAMEALDREDDVLTTLRAGAREAGKALAPASLARRLLGLAEPTWPDRRPWPT